MTGLRSLPVVGELPRDWRVAQFWEVLVGNTRNGLYKPKQFHGSGTKIVNMGELFAHPRLRDVPMKRLRLSPDESGRFCLREGDLLFARRSLVAEGAGKCCLVKEVGEPTVFESSIIRARPNPEVGDSDYLYYLFSSPFGAYSLGSITRQVAVAGITGKDLAALPIPLPPLSEQRRIAGILVALDDRIELNRRTNRTLESIAHAIFNSWFVDFDPVRKKMDGREAGLPPDLAALWPNAFAQSELGPIPVGWRVGRLGNLTDVVDCLHSRKPLRGEAGRPLLQLSNVGNDGLLGMDDLYLIDDEDYAQWTSRFEAMEGDCVITNVGRVGAVAQVPVGIRAALGRNMTGIRCRADFPYPAFLIETLLSDGLRQEIVENTDTGTVLDALNVRNIPHLGCVLPPVACIRAFESAARPLRQLMEAHLREAATLVELRDSLLPLLLSGGVRR